MAGGLDVVQSWWNIVWRRDEKQKGIDQYYRAISKGLRMYPIAGCDGTEGFQQGDNVI